MNSAASLSPEPGDERLGTRIVQAIARWPERVAVVDGDRSLTYAEFGARISQAVQALDALGLRQADVVAQLSGNRIDMLCVMAAAYIHGFCSVTLHSMAGADDHAGILADCNARVFLSEHAYGQRRDWLRDKCTHIQHWYSHDADDGHPDFWALAAKYTPQPLCVRGAPKDIIRLAYTGGTTGKSKGVMLSNRAMDANARLWLAGLAWPDGVRSLCSAPISHGAGSLIFPTLACGGTVVLERGFDAERWLDTVSGQRINTTFIVPTMLYALLEHPLTAQTDLSSLHALIYGAAPMSPARIRQALEVFGNRLVQTYGQTEAPNTILILDQHDHARADDALLASAGRPFPEIEVRLCADDGTSVPTGEIGEVCVRGPLLMSGYHGDPQQTAAALRDGWLCTGDLARQDDAGYFYIVDRKKDMIISGGFNIYPREIEDILATHPDVQASAVIGVPDGKWGESVKAIVVARRALRPEALIEFVRARKGPIYAPKSVEFVDAVPLTGLGKPDKKALREHYWNHQTREIA